MAAEEMPTVFVDECGYTGPDLLDKQQPVFVLASIAATEAECREIKTRFFKGVRASELKHSGLARRDSGQKMILSLLDWLAGSPEIVKFAYAHKEFGLVCKMVDLIVETAMHADGIDAYRDGFNIALSNLLYFVLPPAVGRSRYRELLVRFQRMARSPGRRTYDSFHRYLFNLNCPGDLQGAIDWLKVGHLRLGIRFLDPVDPHFLDFTNAFAFTLAGKWSNSLPSAFDFVHDDSADMRRYRFFWDVMTGPNIPAREVGDARRKTRFPLKIASVTTKRSHDSAGLQIADVLAGAAATALVQRVRPDDQADTYATEVWNRIAEVFHAFPLWPEMKVTPEQLGTKGGTGADWVGFTVKAIMRADES